MLEIITAALNAMRWVELISVIAAIFYVVLAARNDIKCWFFGILSACLWAYAAAAYYQLYVDALLQLYYVGMGIYGWVAWSSRKGVEKPLAISQISLNKHAIIIIIGAILTGVMGYIFGTYTDAAATYWDAFTTAFSVMATVMVARRILENWIYWIVIDTVYIFLYGSRGGYLFALLNVAYVIIAIVGYWQWLKLYHNQENNSISLEEHLVDE